MTSADAMRASDHDRERVVQALQEQVGEGRLTLTEFEERSSEAYSSAKTVADLRALTKDLPVDPLAPPKPPLASWQQPYPMPAVPPWAQRTYNGTPPFRRGVHPVRIAAIIADTINANYVAFDSIINRPRKSFSNFSKIYSKVNLVNTRMNIQGPNFEHH